MNPIPIILLIVLASVLIFTGISRAMDSHYLEPGADQTRTSPFNGLTLIGIAAMGLTLLCIFAV